MNLWNLLALYENSLHAGGPGSGCNGPNCGRPAGHSGKHGRARLGGKFSKQEKAIMRQKGMLINTHTKNKPMPSTPITSRSILKSSIEKMKIPGKKGYVHYKYTELKPQGKQNNAHGTTRWSSEPPNKMHAEAGRFHESLKVDIKAENRKFWAFETLKTQEGHGTTVFINKERTSPNSSRVMLQEVASDRFNEITSTKEIEFKSGRQARDFINFRYQIDIRWTK